MDPVRGKQIGAWGLCAFSVPAVLYLSRCGWAPVLITLMGSGLLVTFGKSPLRGNSNMAEKVFGAVLFLWNTVILGKLGWELGRIQGANSQVPGLLLLILGAYAVKKRVIPVVGAVLLFFLLGVYGTMLLFGVPNVDPTRLIPAEVEEPGALLWGLTPILLLYLNMNGEGTRKRKCQWIMGSGILALGIAAITQGMGTPDFYTAAKSINLFGAMERLEPFVASAVTAGGFCLIGMLFRVNENIWNEILDLKKDFPIKWILILAGVGVFLIPKIGNAFLQVGMSVSWGVIPILTQLVVARKKDEKISKKLKKTLDK